LIPESLNSFCPHKGKEIDREGAEGEKGMKRKKDREPHKQTQTLTSIIFSVREVRGFFLFLLMGLAVSVSAKAGETPARLGFSEFFASGSSRGLVFSEKLRGLNGSSVVMSGYMAPPLKPSLDFFVLTMQPMAICPFCDSDASWPENIVVVYLKRGKSIEATTNALRVTGRLDIGRHIDETTGFVSQIRIYADTIEHIR
jgi:hypothetical protein